MPEGHQQTFAEMTSEQKNNMSHRSRAVGCWLDFLKENGGFLNP
jgi:inosine/xanthosine triphosphate pyrophosphatase family protein